MPYAMSPFLLHKLQQQKLAMQITVQLGTEEIYWWKFNSMQRLEVGLDCPFRGFGTHRQQQRHK